MRTAVRFGSGLALFVVLMLIPMAMAEDEQLELAQGLFDMHEYLAAQEVLLEVDREQLSEEEAATYDRLMKVLPEAIQANAKAEQDMADANKAYEEGRWEEADRLYGQVIANEHARLGLAEEARTQQQRIAEKLELSEAAKPAGPVPDQPPVEPEPPEAEPQAVPPEPAPEVEPEVAEVIEPAPPPAPRRRTLVDELQARDDLLWQRAIAKMQEAAQKAGEAVAAERFDEARQLAERALQVIEANRAYAQPASKYEAARAVARDLKKSVAEEYDRWSRAQAERQRADIAEQVERRRIQQERQRQEKVEQLFSTAWQLKKEQRFREAAEAMRQVLILDPANAKASFWLDTFEDFWSLYEQKQIDREYRRQNQLVLQQAHEVAIPWNQDILYPKNWMEIVARRSGIEGGIGPGDEFELNRKLETIQPEVNFEERPFDQVIDFLTDLNEMNIAVDWEDLGRSGIDRDKPVSIRLTDVKLRTVLREVLTQVGGDVPLSFVVGEGLLRIATKEKLDRNKYALVYDIRDLIVKIPRFANAPLFDQPARGPDGGAAGEVLGSRYSLFGSHSGAETDEAGGNQQPKDETVAEILDIVRQTVEPDSWRETGGGDGALRELNGQLIVYNTSEAHRQARSLLSQLREARALMIGVEARFLIVSSNFLEEIGVDLDFVFNSGTAGFDPAFNAAGAPITDPFSGAQVLMPRPYSQIGIVPAIPPLGGGAMGQTIPAQPYGHAGFVPAPGGIIPQSSRMSPITAQQGSLGLADPRAFNTGIPGSFATQGLVPALNIAGSFLDNLQVDFLIRATQANRRSSIVQAPRLMMFNGQRAWVAVVRNRQYVSSVTPSVAEGAVGVQPVLANAQSGSSLDIEGTISADRKYVTITVRTGLSQEPNFERFEVQRASGNSPGIFILLPDQETRSLRTTVSVPDGGTVLLGGLKQVAEMEIEAGVPILSKIPILKRAFTNTTKVKDTQTLLILLKAKILIQKEAEQEAFPTLTSARPA
jgi:general secretion pathway protein D